MDKGTIETPWMTVDEAAEYARVSRSAIYSWVRAGGLPLHKVSMGLRSASRVHRDELDEALRGKEPSVEPAVADATQISQQAWEKLMNVQRRLARRKVNLTSAVLEARKELEGRVG